MKISNIFSIVIYLIIALFGLNQIAYSRAEPIDYQTMKRDLNIMKVILDRIMSPEKSGLLLTNGNTRAIYLEGNGVIFIYQNTTIPVIISSSDEEALIVHQYDDAIKNYNEVRKKFISNAPKNRRSHSNVSVVTSTPESQLAEKKERELNEKFKSNIIEFLGEYCDALKQLNPNDQISVVILNNTEHYQPLRRLLGLSGQGTSCLIGSVKKADVTEYRRETISKPAFIERIHFETNTKNPHLKKDLQIMTTIFDTVLKESFEAEFDMRGETWGTYLTNFGALFVLKLRETVGGHTFNISNQNDENIYEIFLKQNRSDSKKESQREQKLEKLKSSIISILADYGHTMRRLKADEWLGVALELNGFLHDENGPSTLFFKIRKSDIDAFNQKRVNLEQFKERLVVREY